MLLIGKLKKRITGRSDEPQKKFEKTKKKNLEKFLYWILILQVKIDIDDLHWSYLNGDGDFNSPEVGNYCDKNLLEKF